MLSVWFQYRSDDALTVNMYWTVHCGEQRKTTWYSLEKAFHYFSVVLCPKLINIIVEAMSD